MVNLIELVRYYIAKLVNNPNLVEISEIITEEKHIISVKVAGNDLARVIGKEGRVFRALKSLIHAVEPTIKRDIIVDVADNTNTNNTTNNINTPG